jgi:hypothetical protein
MIDSGGGFFFLVGDGDDEDFCRNFLLMTASSAGTLISDMVMLMTSQNNAKLRRV